LSKTNNKLSTKENSSSKPQSNSSEQRKKRMKLALKIVGFDSSDEDGNII